jgi:hypothetical protein
MYVLMGFAQNCRNYRINVFVKVFMKLSHRILSALNTTVSAGTVSLYFVNRLLTFFFVTAAIENNGCAKAGMVSHWPLIVGA